MPVLNFSMIKFYLLLVPKKYQIFLLRPITIRVAEESGSR